MRDVGSVVKPAVRNNDHLAEFHLVDALFQCGPQCGLVRIVNARARRPNNDRISRPAKTTTIFGRFRDTEEQKKERFQSCRNQNRTIGEVRSDCPGNPAKSARKASALLAGFIEKVREKSDVFRYSESYGLIVVSGMQKINCGV
jgi:hypothetical protein